MKSFYVYIASNFANTVLYTGITNNLKRRISEHKQKLIPGFTSRYNVNKLLFFEIFPTAIEAIAAEKKIKGWTREKKIALIRSKNPALTEILI